MFLGFINLVEITDLFKSQTLSLLKITIVALFFTVMESDLT